MMMDYAAAREKMVDCQVRTCDVTNHALLNALLSVPREKFVPDAMAELAYIDDDIALDNIGGEGRYLMAPASFAKLSQMAKVQPDDVVLVVGSGCGYSAAVFSLLASSVVAVEDVEALSEYSAQHLEENGFDNVAVLNKPSNQGFSKEAPYDVIFVDGCVDEVPEVLLEQLGEGGRLVAVVGRGNSAMAQVWENTSGIVSHRSVMNCCVKPLPGFGRELEFEF